MYKGKLVIRTPSCINIKGDDPDEMTHRLHNLAWYYCETYDYDIEITEDTSK